MISKRIIISIINQDLDQNANVKNFMAISMVLDILVNVSVLDYVDVREIEPSKLPIRIVCIAKQN